MSGVSQGILHHPLVNRVSQVFIVQVSITFDPLMYLPLPFPFQKFWNHVIHWLPWRTRKCRLKVPIQLPRDASCKDMKKLLSRWFDTPVENVRISSHPGPPKKTLICIHYPAIVC